MSNVGRTVQFVGSGFAGPNDQYIQAGIVIADGPVVLAVFNQQDGTVTVVTGASEDPTQTQDSSYKYVT